MQVSVRSTRAWRSCGCACLCGVHLLFAVLALTRGVQQRSGAACACVVGAVQEVVRVPANRTCAQEQRTSCHTAAPCTSLSCTAGAAGAAWMQTLHAALLLCIWGPVLKRCPPGSRCSPADDEVDVGDGSRHHQVRGVASLHATPPCMSNPRLPRPAYPCSHMAHCTCLPTGAGATLALRWGATSLGAGHALAGEVCHLQLTGCCVMQWLTWDRTITKSGCGL